MSLTQMELTPERRALLARKGRILYGKYCGTGGRGICAESFALHQLRQGDVEVVDDLLRFLDAQLVALREHDPEELASMTEGLAERVRRHLENEA